MNGRHDRLGCPVFYLIAFALSSLAIGSMAKAEPAGIEPSPADVVSRYMQAWTQGDLVTMHSLWDSRTQRAITLDDLRKAFTLRTSPGDAASSAVRDASAVLIAGRPSSVVRWETKQTGTLRAEADVVAEYTAGSETGLDSLFLHMDKWEFAPSESGDDSRGWMLALAAETLLKPKTVDTARGQSHVFTATLGSRTISLRLRRLTLVREADGWRIANAADSHRKSVTVQTASRRGRP